MGQSVAMKISTAPEASFTSSGRWVAPPVSFSSISAAGRDAGGAWRAAGAACGAGSSAGRSQDTAVQAASRQANRVLRKARLIIFVGAGLPVFPSVGAAARKNAAGLSLLYLPQPVVEQK